MIGVIITYFNQFMLLTIIVTLIFHVEIDFVDCTSVKYVVNCDSSFWILEN